MSAAARATRPEPPPLWLACVHLGVLWAFAVGKPLFDLLGRNPEFFVARHSTAGEITILAIALVAAAPLAMVAVEALAGRISRSAGVFIQLLFVGVLLAAVALQMLKEVWPSATGGVLVAIASGLGAGGAFAYSRTRFAPAVLSVLGPTPALFLFLFLVASPVSKVVFPRAEASAPAVRVARPAPVVVVIFDEFPSASIMTPSGAIDASRFPGFARLAKHSIWYRSATGVASHTDLAVPAILSGGVPDDADALPITSDYPANLFTWLGESYRVHAFETVTDLCPDRICPEPDLPSLLSRLEDVASDLRVASEHLLLPDDLAEGLPRVDQSFGGFGEDDTQIESGGGAVDVVSALRESGRSADVDYYPKFLARIDAEPATLDFIHLEWPHHPWDRLPDGKGYLAGPFFERLLDVEARWDADPDSLAVALQEHLLATGYVDSLVERLIRRLHETGAWTRAMVVVTADHGGAFIDGLSRRAAEPGNLGEIAPVPLFVKLPGQRQGRVSDAHVCTSDILALIGDALDIDTAPGDQECPPHRVVIANNSSDVGAPLGRVMAERLVAIRRIARLFGTGTGWRPVYRLGPHADLIGRRVSELPVSPHPEPGFDLFTPRSAFRVDPDSFLLPVLARGSFESTAVGAPLAIALNGTIAAVGKVLDIRGEREFRVILPPDSLRAGRNTLSVYRVVDDGSRLQLLAED